MSIRPMPSALPPRADSDQPPLVAAGTGQLTDLDAANKAIEGLMGTGCVRDVSPLALPAPASEAA